MGILSPQVLQTLEQSNGLPAGLLGGVIGQESSGNVRAVSKKGAGGLTQLMPATAQELGVTDVFDPMQNATGGAKHLGGLIKKYGGDVDTALKAYNWGQGNMDAYLKTGKGAKGQAMPQETQDYAGKVMSKAGLVSDPLDDMLRNAKNSTSSSKPSNSSADPLDDMLRSATSKNAAPEPSNDLSKAQIAKKLGVSINNPRVQTAFDALKARANGGGAQDVSQAQSTGVLGAINHGFANGLGGIYQGEQAVRDAAGRVVNAAVGHKVLDTNHADQSNKDFQQYNQGYEQSRLNNGQTGIDVGSLAGNVMAAAPTILVGGQALSGVKLLSSAGAKALATNAGIGAGIGAGNYASDNDQRLENMGLGAAGGAGGAMAGKAIGAVAGKIGKTANNALRPTAVAAEKSAKIDQSISEALSSQGINFNALNDHVKNTLRQHATDALKHTDDLNPQAVANQAALADVGMTGTKGQLIKDTSPEQWTLEKNLGQRLGVGDSLRAKFAQDHRQLVSKLNDLVSMGNGKTGNQFDTASSLADAANTKVNEARQQINKLWDDARNSSGLEVHLDGQRFAADANQSLYDALAEGELPSGVHRILTDLLTGKAPLTVHNAQTMIQRLNALYNPAVRDPKNVAIKTVRQALEKELDTTLANPSSISKVNQLINPNSPINPVDAADAIQKFRVARQASKQLFDTLDNNPMLKAADSNHAPDDFFKKYILQAKQRDLTNLKQALGTQHQQAWNDARGEVLQAIRDRAVSANGEFLPNGIDAAIKSIGEHRLSVLLNPDELSLLAKIQKAGKIATQDPIEGRWNRSGTGAAINDMAGTLLDGLAKAKLSAPVVNFITRAFNNSKATSAAEAAASGAGAFAGKAPKGSMPDTSAAAQFHTKLANRIVHTAMTGGASSLQKNK